jgi:hypothetical protein
MNATSPKPPILNKNTTKIQILTTVTKKLPEWSPLSTQSTTHFPVVLSLLPAFADYIISAQNSSTFKNPTTDIVLEPTTPVVTIYKPCTPTVNVTTPENTTTTAEFNQKYPETNKALISGAFNWADNAGSSPTTFIIPTKHPHDLSSLRSSSSNPFSSLQRHRRQPRKYHRSIKFSPQYCPCHAFQEFHFHLTPPHTPCHPSQLCIPVSLDWEQDPLLADLSNAL